MNKHTLKSLFVGAAFGLSACGDVADQASAQEAGELMQQTAPTSVTVPGGQSVDVENPAKTYIASFRAEGSGCPKGTWDAEISSDGLSVTAYFDSYEIIANKTDLQTKYCGLVFDFKSPAGLSIGVTSIDYMGAVDLFEGQTATQSAYYSFIGGLGSSANVEGSTIRASTHTLEGPRSNEGYVFNDKVETRDVVYSECGRPSALVVNTHLLLRNPKREDRGGINMNIVNASHDTKLVVNLAQRECPRP